MLNKSARSAALRAAAFATVLASAAFAQAVAITPGNLIIYRVGTGTGSLSNTTTRIFLDEYTTAGGLVQSIPVPFTGSPITAVGNATTEGVLNVNAAGTAVIFTGYVAGTGTATATGNTVAKAVGTLSLAGTVATAATFTHTSGSITVRSADTVDGSSYYIGTSAALSYMPTPGVNAALTTIDARNSRQVSITDNVVYGSNGSTSITAKVQSYGTLPTTLTTPSPVVSLGSTDAVNGFALVDLDPSVAGADTLYALSTVEGRLRKYTFNGTTWGASGFVSTVAQNLTAFTTPTGVDIFLTTSTALLKISDNSGYNGTLTGSVTALATAATNTGFRGIAIIPEPTALGFLALALPLASRRRR